MGETAIAVLTSRCTVAVQSEAEEAAESANLIVLRKARKELEAKFDELKKPFKQGLDNLRDEFARVVAPIETAERLTSAAILAWKAQERARIETEKAAAEKVRQEQIRAAAATHKPAPPPPMPVTEQARGWQTDRGTMTTRRVPKWRVVDETLIPYEIVYKGETVKLWQLIDGAITKVRRDAGDQPSSIPGIEFYYEEGLNVR